MNRYAIGIIIASIILIIFVALVLRFDHSDTNSVQNIVTPSPEPGEKINTKTPAYKGDQTKIELYQGAEQIKIFTMDDLSSRQSPIPSTLSEREARPLEGHSVVLISDLISGLDLEPDSTIRIASYNNNVVEYPAEAIVSKKNQLILVSTNEPAWKLADFSYPETLGGRERSGQSGFIMRNVRSVTVLTSSTSGILEN